MPLTYTHLRFGKKCLKNLPEDILNIVKRNIDYFIYGCQGPDIFYYYNLLKDNDIKKYGEQLHGTPIKDTLSLFKTNIKRLKRRDCALAYTLGYLSHFLLDSYCNTYIKKASIKTNIPKEIINKEIEKYFFNKDKIDISKYDIAKPFKPSKELTETIYSLYNNFKLDTYKKIIYDYKTKLFLINDNTALKKDIIYTFFNILNKKESINYTKDDKKEECFPFCIRCDKYFEIAVIHYKLLVKNYMEYLIKNENLIEYFNNNMDIKEKDEDISVLDIKDELKYIIYDYQN